jgi:ABC-type multidrug transport system fused ATPase/permease subunit
MSIFLKTTKSTIGLIRNHYLLAVLALVLGLLASCLDLLSASLIMPLLQVLGDKSAAINLTQSSNFLDKITNFYLSLADNWKWTAILLSFLGVTIAKNFNQYFSSISINKLQLKIGVDVREKCVKRLLNLEVGYFNRSKIGQLLSYISEHTQKIESLTSYILEIITDAITIIVLLFLLLNISWILTIIASIGLIIIAISLKPLLKSVQFYGRKSANYIEHFSSLVTEIIVGIRVVKSFNAEVTELNKTQQVLQSKYETELKGYKYNSAVAPLMETTGIGILILLLAIGASVFASAADAKLTILITYIFALLRVLPKVNHLNSMRSQISLLSGSLDAVEYFLSSTSNLHLPDGDLAFTGIKSAIKIENLNFYFPDQPLPILNNINLQISRGTTVALVGASGSGKSTLVDLLMRFDDPTSGSIQVDNIDLKKIKLDTWRKSLAMVSQDTFLFHASVKENIAYGYQNATDAEIIEAAKKAYAYEFIQDFPQGFDTIVGNRGTKLSGGQRQRIAIARAILREPDLLILDEATSALDTNSERIVQKAIEEVSLDRTVLVIAHRLSTVEKADKIVVLDRGIVVEQGTHQELLQQKGEYWSLYNSQVTYSHSTNY